MVITDVSHSTQELFLKRNSVLFMDAIALSWDPRT